MKHAKADLLVSLVRERFDYDEATGILSWKEGGIAGYVNQRGYRKVKIQQGTYFAHRIIWLLKTGQWPVAEIDHVDGDPGNNRWSNLRAATRQQNAQNSRVRKWPYKSTQLKGASYNAKKGKWRASIRNWPQPRVFLGYFATEGEAQMAYWKAAQDLFGEFARER